MNDIQLIDIREAILTENDNAAEEIRKRLKEHNVFLMNLMASPGAGKTSLILATIDALAAQYRIAVIEGDIDSIVDAEKVSSKNIPSVQLRTGGACHLDAPMIGAALDKLDLANLDLVIVENIGNLVCPAEFDIGANLRVMMTSVPEGDDKILKYPLMFSVCDAMIINKIDYLPDPGFDPELLRTRVSNLNPGMRILPLSCRAGTDVDAWVQWLEERIQQA